MENEKDLKAEEIIKWHAIYAAGAGLIPVSLVDIAAVTAIQLDMMRQLSRLYGFNFSENEGKGWVTAISTSTLAKAGSSLLKLVPGVGTILGGASMSLFSGASSYAIGQAFYIQLKTKGNFDDFDLEESKKAYKEAFEQGKEKIKSWKDGVMQSRDEQMSQAEDTPKPQTSPAEPAPEPEKTEAPKQEPQAEPEDAISKLERLAAMRDKGLLSDEEFQVMKNKLLGLF